MRDKKAIILVILSVLAVVSLIYGINAAARRPAGGKKDAGKPVEKAKSFAIAGRKAKRTSYRQWKRNPFVQPGAAKSGLVLNGIIWDTANPKAMIGNVFVSKGDSLEGYKVVDIKPKSVILNDGTRDTELTLEK